MLKPSKKPIQQTVILCLVTLLLTFPKHFGFMLGFVFLLLLPSLFKSLYFIFVRHEERKQRAVQTIIWSITFSVVIIHHAYLHKSTRDFAEIVSSGIISYHKGNGIYPESVEDIGLDTKSVKDRGLYYSRKNDAVFLFYPATWIIYDVYMFDFENQIWAYQV